MVGLTIALPISGFAGCVMAAAVNDVRTLRIPNWLTLLIFSLFGAYAALALDPAAFGSALALAIAALVVGYVAYARGMMGGGDAKLLAACMAWAGPAHALEFLAVTGIAGGVIALVLVSPFTTRAAAAVQRGWPIVVVGSDGVRRTPMPYGAAIAAGALTVAARLLAS